MTTAIGESWWDPARHAARRPRLIVRNRIASAIRAWFAASDFVEVDCASLQVSPGNETHLHGFETTLLSTAGERATLYLHTSPEFACKKLLAAGEARLFTLAKVFRNRERGRLHSPEFTMLEWYRAHETYEALMADCAALLVAAADAAQVERLSWRNLSADPRAVPERLTVLEAFTQCAGIDLGTTFDAERTDVEALSGMARAAGIRVADDDTWSDVFSRVLVEKIEPTLGHGRASLLIDYPIHEAALARPKPGAPHVSERFELYACGVELANAFTELTDVQEQRRRFEADMAEKARIYGERYPVDDAFLDALAIMPPATGAALGFERLVMLLTGAAHIDEVTWAPVTNPFSR